jgi:glucose/arabinose dehydrogenase
MVLSGCVSRTDTQATASTSQPAKSAIQPTSTTDTTTNGAITAANAILNQSAGASASVKVQVPQSMRTGAFAQDRTLNVPPKFALAVYARIPNARFMAETPNGDLLVSVPVAGKIMLVQAVQGSDPRVSEFVTGLRNPHDIVFHTIGNTTYMYVSESNQIDRYIYHQSDAQAQGRQVVVPDLPDSRLPEMHGVYSHELKNIALDSNHKLYVSIGSSCNVCLSDTMSNPLRGAIYQYNADGSAGRLYARGLRNAEGLAFIPGTNELWVAVNNRDNLAYPHQDATGQYGKVIPAYVDNHPPEEFTHVRDGGNYGWPFCNPSLDQSVDTMPFERDVQFNADGHVDCSKMDRIDKGIQAHSAPLGLAFMQDAKTMQVGALIGLHGSWNRTIPTGYKVIYFPWNMQTKLPGKQIDLVTGWSDNGSLAWGRPVDSIVDQQGNILISDDASGTVYKLSYNA